MLADWSFNLKIEQFWSGNHLESIRRYFYHHFLEMIKSQHLELFLMFFYDHAKMITWIMAIWEWFLQNCRSELEPEVVELEDLTVQP